jgi:hypothetical protein
MTQALYAHMNNKRKKNRHLKGEKVKPYKDIQALKMSEIDKNQRIVQLCILQTLSF